MLSKDSVRGGILSHASIAKVTANGSVTTPVKRGSFVLKNLLGLPSNPPPPGVGSIEPDTRGATTIRETLKLHQSIENCAVCHRRIDPPGFAMECFDPVGGYREQYRLSKGVQRTAVTGLRFLHKDYDLGRKVDCEGVTADGMKFKDIREFKKLLLGSQQQVTRNLVSQLIAFATGAVVQFADREEVERILSETDQGDAGLKEIIRQIVHCRMFLER